MPVTGPWSRKWERGPAATHDRKTMERARPGPEGGERPQRSLMARIHDGDRSAMDELLERFWIPLVAYAEEIVHDRDEAEDVVQDVVMRIWERRTEWTPTDRLQAFLYRITRNLALNRRRARSARSRLLERLSSTLGRAPAPDEDFEHSSLARAVRERIDALPVRQREVFILARFHRQRYREIAEILDISPQTVANHMSAALAQLRKDLRRVYEEHGAEGL